MQVDGGAPRVPSSLPVTLILDLDFDPDSLFAARCLVYLNQTLTRH